MKKKRSIAALIGGMILSLMVLTGCTAANPPSAFCGWIQGDGSQDSRVHKILLPNDTANAGTSETVKYVPCNSRNYIVTDGSQKGVNGKVTGDSTTPVTAYTKDKTQVDVALTAYWTLNEGKDAFTDFIALCQKYNCATDASNSDAGAESNFSTPGWNGMLAENFYPSIRAAVQNVTPQFDNKMWQNGGSADERKSYADAVSADFMKQIQLTTGYDADLFCGSGSKFTTDQQTDFICNAVRFRIDQVSAKDASVQRNLNVESQSQQIIDANKARLEQAKALYGDQAPYWLGLHDAAAGCANGSTCQFLIKPSNP